jgi:DNA-binding CsgD family transcriptional regulator
VSKSSRLRLNDVRGAFRLVGECRDLGGDPAGWLTRMLDGGRELVGSEVAFVCLCRVPGGLFYPQLPLATVDTGWESPAHRAVWTDSLFTGYHLRSVDFLAYQSIRQPGLTVSRRRLVGDSAWYTSEEYNRYRRPSGTDNYVVSAADAAVGPTSVFVHFSRLIGRPRFTRREVRLVWLLQQELARLLGGPLAVGPDPTVGLPPRLRRTLACLLDGDSEKQVAVRLAVSRHTVHQYVKELYRHFDVTSRGELHARCARRPG